METTFKSTGLVYGNFWGGGSGAYQAKKLTGKTKEEIIEKAIEGLDGSLDDGMGFQRLLGALLCITKISTTEINGKEFVNEESETEFVGELNEKEQDFLENVAMEQGVI